MKLESGWPNVSLFVQKYRHGRLAQIISYLDKTEGDVYFSFSTHNIVICFGSSKRLRTPGQKNAEIIVI